MSSRVHVAAILSCVVLTIATPAWAQESAEQMLQSALYKQQVEGDLQSAIELYAAIATHADADRLVAARALLQLGLAYETLGAPEAVQAYRDVVAGYSDQSEIAERARDRLAYLEPGAPALAPADRGLVARRIWGDPMAWWIMAGSVAPNGRDIAATYWISDRPDNTGDLIVLDSESGDVRVVGETMAGSRDGSTGDTYVNGFLWSNDGARLAYSEWTYGLDPDFQALHVVNADGSGHRIVSSNPQNADLRPRAWSSDGRWIVALVTGWDSVSRIARISMEDGTTTILKTLRSGFGNTTGQFMTLSLSPDDRYLAYAYAPTPGDEPDIRVLAVDGSSETVIAPSGAADVSPLWTPDGSRLVFLSERSGSGDLWGVDMIEGRAAGDPYVVNARIGSVRLLGITENGSLAYAKPVPMSDLRLGDLADDAGPFERDEQLTDRFVGLNSDPVWSPDGTRVAFKRTRWGVGFSPRHEIVVRTLSDGSESVIELRGLVSYANGMTRPQWAADGRSVSLPALHPEEGSDGVPASYVVDLETGEMQREARLRSSQGLMHNTTGRQEDRLRALGVRIDGFRYIVENIESGRESLRPGERLLWVRGVLGWVKELGCDPERAYEGAWCVPDYRVGILVEPLHGEPTGPYDLRDWRLSPDGEEIAYLQRGDGGVRDLWVWSLAGDDGPKLLLEAAGTGAVNWTADGEYVLFTRAENTETAPIVRIPADGGPPEPLPWTLEARQLTGVSFSPDGQRAAYTVGGPNPLNEIWLLSGFPWQQAGRE